MRSVSRTAKLSLCAAALYAAGATSAASAQSASAAPQGPVVPRIAPAPAPVNFTPVDPIHSAASFGKPGARPAAPGGAPVMPPGSRSSDRPPGLSAGGGNGGEGGGGVQDAGITLIGFEALRHDDANVTFNGTVYIEDGFEFTKNQGEAFDFATFGTQDSRFPGSTAMFNDTAGGTTYMFPVDGSNFSLQFMEFANLNNLGPASTTVNGVKFDGTIVSQVCQTIESDNREDTFYFSGFNDLSYVYWTQDSPYLQFDNIGVVRQPIVMDFQGLEIVDNGIHAWGTEYYEDGFLIDQNPGEPNQLETFGTLEGRYPGSTALFDDTVNGVVTLTQYGGGTFNAHSIDLSCLNNSGPVSVTFVGTRAGGDTVTKTFTTAGAPVGLQTFHFSGFNNLVSMSWTQSSPFHQFDNIVLSRGQQTLDFAKLYVGDDQEHDWGRFYRQDGFLITEDPNDSFDFTTFGGQASRFPGSTALFNDTIGGLIHIDTIDNTLFQLRGIEIAPLNGADQSTVNFVGHRHDGAVLNRSFTTSGASIRLETVLFDGDWHNLDDVEWHQDAPYHQFDNVRLVRQTALMDFQKLEHVDSNLVYVGASYSESGFTLTKGPGEPFDFATFGTLEPRYPTSTAVFNDTIGGLIHLAATDGGDFDLLQMDISEENNFGLGPVTVNFVGTKTDGSQVFQSFTAYDPNANLQTCQFVGFDTLKYVEWTQDSPFHQFDNIVVVEAAPQNNCYPDCDHSGSLDLFDFLCFTNDFNVNGSYSDCDGNGTHDLFDFLCYVNAFNAGC